MEGVVIGGLVQHVVADDMAGSEVVGPDLRIFLVRWRKHEGVLRRCLVATVTRPLVSFTPEQLVFLGEAWTTRCTLH